MSDVIKLAAIAVAGALCAVAIRKYVPEIAMVLALTAGVLILCSCLRGISEVLAALRKFAEYGGISEALLEPVLKVAGIGVVTNAAAEICRDAKEGGLAGIVETAGTVLGLLAALPLAASVLSLLAGLL